MIWFIIGVASGAYGNKWWTNGGNETVKKFIEKYCKK